MRREDLRINLLIRQRDAPERVSPAILSIAVLVDVVSQVNHVVNGLLSYGIAVRVEKAESCVMMRWWKSRAPRDNLRKLLHEYMANLMAEVTLSRAEGMVLVLPRGEVLFEPQTWNW